MDVQQNISTKDEDKTNGSSFFHGNISILTNDGEFEDEINPCEDYDERENEIQTAMYWESQQALLQEILEQYRSIGSKLREGIITNVERARESSICECTVNRKTQGCGKCLRRRVVHLLCEKGFNVILCISRWKHTSKIPGGVHEYIEVITSTHGRKKKIPMLIELEFRDEFKMGKACKEYTKLISQLPEVFIGKSKHLNAIVRLMCDAAKKSTEQQRIHLGPWRKRKFMQMKWSASSVTANGRLVDLDNQMSSKLRLNINITPRQTVDFNDASLYALEFAAGSNAVKVA